MRGKPRWACIIPANQRLSFERLAPVVLVANFVVGLRLGRRHLNLRACCQLLGPAFFPTFLDRISRIRNSSWFLYVFKILFATDLRYLRHSGWSVCESPGFFFGWVICIGGLAGVGRRTALALYKPSWQWQREQLWQSKRSFQILVRRPWKRQRLKGLTANTHVQLTIAPNAYGEMQHPPPTKASAWVGQFSRHSLLLPSLFSWCFEVPSSTFFGESSRFAKPMESQTSVSKRAPREFRNWRVQGNLLTLRQPFANPVPTLRQPFANLSPTLCQPFLPTPPQPPLSLNARHQFRDTGLRFLGKKSSNLTVEAWNQRKTKGQQLKGKIVSEFFTLFHNFSHFFRIFPPGLSPSKQRVLAQGEQKRRKDNKKNRTNRCCTLVVARLSSSCVSHYGGRKTLRQ